MVVRERAAMCAQPLSLLDLPFLPDHTLSAKDRSAFSKLHFHCLVKVRYRHDPSALVRYRSKKWGCFRLLRSIKRDVRNGPAGAAVRLGQSRQERSSRPGKDNVSEKKKASKHQQTTQDTVPTRDEGHLVESVECWKRRQDTGSSRRVGMKKI